MINRSIIWFFFLLKKQIYDIGGIIYEQSTDDWTASEGS